MKHFLICVLLLLLMSGNVLAEEGIWFGEERVYTSPAWRSIQAAFLYDDGGMVMAGRIGGDVREQGYVLRLDKEGRVLYERFLDNELYDAEVALGSRQPDGGLLLMSRTSVESEREDTRLVWLDAQGDIVKERQMDHHYKTGFPAHNAGMLIVGRRLKPEDMEFNSQIVSLVDRDGAFIWEESGGWNAGHYIGNAAPVEDGYLIDGAMQNLNDITAFAAKVNTEGGLEWLTMVEGPHLSFFADTALTPDEGLYAIGFEPVDGSDTFQFRKKAWRFGEDGELLWSRTYPDILPFTEYGRIVEHGGYYWTATSKEAEGVLIDVMDGEGDIVCSRQYPTQTARDTQSTYILSNGDQLYIAFMADDSPMDSSFFGSSMIVVPVDLDIQSVE